MSTQKWLNYDGQTTNELIALEGKYRTDSLVSAFEQAIQQKAERLGEDKLTAEERIVLAIEAMEREVNNGGFWQFFVNSSGEYAPLLVEALQRIGCLKTAIIAQEAMEIRAQFAGDDDEDQQNIERIDALTACDERYFQRPEDIEQALFEFITKNRSAIVV
jgi:aspartokinase